jgi:L-fuculose-phosphate aldolase
MALEHVVVVDFEGEPVWGDAMPSSELLMHAAIYAARPDVDAIVHTHSVYASALAVAGQAIPALIDEMVVHVGDSVQVAGYGFPGTRELAERVVAALGERNAVLMRNHGVVGVGKTMTEALHVCQLVERMAHIYVVARTLGHDHLLPADVAAAELELFRMRQQAKLL